MLDKKHTEHWETKKLKQVSNVVSGYAFKSSDFIDKGVPVIKISNIGYSDFIWKGQQYLNKTFLKTCEGYRIFPGDLLIALTRPITNDTTKVCKYPSNAQIGLLNQRVACIKESDVEKDFLFWYFQTQTFKSYIRSKFSETLQPNLSPKDLELTPIPFCSPSQQKKIISKIEELFSELDKGIENLRIAQQQLKTYRQSVLKWAFEGKLTNENVKERELPSVWKSKRLGDMFDFIGGGTPSKSEKDYWNGNIFWASVKDVKGNYLNKTQDTITEKGLKNSASNLAEPGDVILITRISPGKSIISNVKSAINQDLKIAKPKFKTTSKFINYFFNAIERDCIKIASGTTVLGITLNNLNELEIPELNIEEQNNVVQEIESRLSVADKMEESITQSLQQAEALRQSILKKAFEGRLVK